MPQQIGEVVARGARRRSQVRRAGGVVTVLAGLAVVAAACGGASGPGVASAPTTTSTTTPSSPSSGGSGNGPSSGSSPNNGGQGTSFSSTQGGVTLAYSRCMRSHGVPDYPDPNSNGEVSFSSNGHNSDLDPGSPTFQAAQRACAKYSAGGKATPAEQAQRQAKALQFSQCMRAHGLHDFPDPNAQGGISISAGPGSDLDPYSPTFKAAQRACQSIFGKSKSTGPSSKPSGGGK